MEPTPTQQQIDRFIQAFAMDKTGRFHSETKDLFFGRVVQFKKQNCYVPKDMAIYNNWQKVVFRHLSDQNK